MPKLIKQFNQAIENYLNNSSWTNFQLIKQSALKLKKSGRIHLVNAVTLKEFNSIIYLKGVKL